MSTRELDLGEVYYELIDRIWPMNVLCALELGDGVDRDRVEAAWAQVADLVPVVGARVDRAGGETRLAFGPPGVRPAVASYDDLPTALAAEARSRIPLGTGPVARCSVVGPAATTLVLAVHHAVLDGRALAQLALVLARVIAGEDVTGHPLLSPTVPLSRFAPPESDWRSRRREMLALARAVREEETFVGNADAPGWHDAGLDRERDPRFVTFALSGEESTGLVEWARANGATVQGAVSAAVVRAARGLGSASGRLGLATPVDLRARALAPADAAIGQAAAVLAGSYAVSGSAAEIARAVSTDVRRRVDRGEGELFFALSGADRLPVGEATDKVVRGWTSNATPAVCISNLGVVPGAAPDLLRGLTFGLAPTPNQVAFVFAATFGGRLSFSVGYDAHRLAVDGATLADAVRSELLSLADRRPHGGRGPVDSGR